MQTLADVLESAGYEVVRDDDLEDGVTWFRFITELAEHPDVGDRIGIVEEMTVFVHVENVLVYQAALSTADLDELSSANRVSVWVR